MSLITSNFYSLVMGLVFLDAKMPPLYPFAYVLVLLGVIAYNLIPPPTSDTEVESCEDEQSLLKPSETMYTTSEE
ncbi:hypothetical protein EC973_000926 [Apophysomyces ossiformis]|uniref:Uncharacterized protein n=1 Tax=Apophysomyces ossiformis TaxID=679940 RepID=A0A8H7BUG5_9FUNG|nr:hypothetical protein EC973_000926 [Apophysomyces ossiformis]